MYGILSDRRVDDELNISVRHMVKDVRTSFIELPDSLDRDLRFHEKVTGLAGSHELKAGFAERFRDRDNFKLVLVVDGNKSCSPERKSRLRTLLSFVERHAGRRRKAQDFACGAHLGTEDRIDFLEHVEREDSFLDTVIRDLTLAESGDR